MMKYVIPSVEIFSMSAQDVLTFSFQAEGNASGDVLSFDRLKNTVASDS